VPTNSSDFSFSRSSRGDSLASTSNRITGDSPETPTPSRSSTAAIVRHRFLPPRDVLLTGLRPQSGCLIRELIQEKRPTRLSSQTGSRISSAGAVARRALPGCSYRSWRNITCRQPPISSPIMRCEIRRSKLPPCLAEGRNPNWPRMPLSCFAGVCGRAQGGVHRPRGVPQAGLTSLKRQPPQVALPCWLLPGVYACARGCAWPR